MRSIETFISLASLAGVIGSVWFVVRRYAPAVNSQAISETTRATAEAWRERSEQQETEILDLESKVKMLTDRVVDLESEQKVLRDYAAPEAIKRFETQQLALLEQNAALVQQNTVIVEILKAIQSEISRTSPASSVRSARKD